MPYTYSSATSKRQAKIDHVSNLEGSTEYDVIMLLSVFLSTYWIWKVIAMRLGKSFYAMEFFVIVIPLLLSTTLLSDNVGSLLKSLFVVILLLHLSSPLPVQRKGPGKHEAFVNAARCYLQFSTCIAILAVDFNSFPRRFAKTESFGISWMDVGVGAFIFSSGLVAGSRSQTNSSSLLKTVRLITPSLVLGLVRLISTKTLNYQEHVSEYGVHWNFFITLGILPIFVNLQNILIGSRFQPSSGLLAILAYQYVLGNYGLEYYILNAPRDTLLSMNREGLASLIGFYSIFSISSYIGSEIIVRRKSLTSRAMFLGGCLISFSAMYYISVYNFQILASRRMANFPFVMFVCAVFSFILLGFLLIDYFFLNDQREPVLFRSINRNQLLVFLIANLVTGLVNLTSDTLSVTDLSSFAILLLYSFFTGLVGCALDFADFTFKV